MWNDQDEIDKFKEILEVIDGELTENTEEHVREIIDEQIDEYGARVLEGYKWLRGEWSRTDFMKSEHVKAFRESIIEAIAYAEECKRTRNYNKQSLSMYQAERDAIRVARRIEFNAPPVNVNAEGDNIVHKTYVVEKKKGIPLVVPRHNRHTLKEACDDLKGIMCREAKLKLEEKK